MDSEEIDCSLNHNKDDPNEDIHVCTRYEKLKDNLQNNDNLIITASSANGGFLKLNNYDYSIVGEADYPVYYEGKSVTRNLTITVDIEAPTHCSLNVPRDKACIGYALNIGDPYTTLSELKVKWSTWVDYISGLTATSYDPRICKMVEHNDVLIFDDTCVGLNHFKIGNYYEAESELTSPGVYCAVLTVSDVASNIRLARRCLIFDNQSEISIADDKPITWKSVDNIIEVSWQGHFVNQLHIDQSMLHAIEIENDVINEAYDSDALPAGRTLSSIDNRLGIVKFEVGVAKDGLQPNWMALPNDLEEMFVYQVNNGEEIITFWIRATDVINNTKTDFVSIHIDSLSLSIGHIGGIAGGGVVFVILALLLVVVLFKAKTKRQNPQTFEDNTGHEIPAYTNVQPNPYATSLYPPPEYMPYLPGAANTKKELVEDVYTVPFSQGVIMQEINTANEIHPDELRKDDVILKGNHSLVYRGKVPCLGLTDVAIKTVKEDHSFKEKERMLHEIKMIRLLPRHENIIRLLGFTSIRDPVALVLEFAPYADLSKYLQSLAQESPYDNQIEQIPSARLCTYAQQVCSGMLHIQHKKIIHRNLEARNILVGDNMICKITDFGRAVEADIDGTFLETEKIQLPVRWTAVEGLSTNKGLFSMKSDVWSFGVLMWEILTLGSKPYENMSNNTIMEEVIGGLRLPKPQNCSNELYTVMNACWHSTPDSRPSFESLAGNLDNVISSNQQSVDTSSFDDGEEYMGLDGFRR